MACNCISDIEARVLERLQEQGQYKKPVENVAMKEVAFLLSGNVGVKTVNKLEITLEGQKKKESMSMIHTFCPFCGTKYDEQAEQEASHV